MHNKNLIRHVSGFVKKHPFILFIAFMAWLTGSAFLSHPKAHPDWHTLNQSKAEVPKDTSALRIPLALPSMPPVALFVNEGKREINPLSNTCSNLIEFAVSLEGTPYRYGGKSPEGFDCSGFVHFVFDRFNVALNRSSRAQARQGEVVERSALKKGDLLFFKGTNPSSNVVGHVGIVISEGNEPLRFVHSSSNGGVKISELEGYYETRFLFARRML